MNCQINGRENSVLDFLLLSLSLMVFLFFGGEHGFESVNGDEV